MNELCRLLLNEDPYDGFDASDFPADYQGWAYSHYLFETIIERLRPTTIVEVGSWKGMSAICMAKIAERLNLDTRIICVDTWLGSAEHVINSSEGPNESTISRKHGYPTLYYTFLANVIRSGCADRIAPLPQDSISAAEVLKHKGIRPEFIYIDAAHDSVSVQRDLSIYYRLLADDGLIMGDDHLVHPGVTEAVVSFAKANGLYFCGDLTKFILCKGAKYFPRLCVATDTEITDIWGATGAALRRIEEDLSSGRK